MPLYLISLVYLPLLFLSYCLPPLLLSAVYLSPLSAIAFVSQIVIYKEDYLGNTLAGLCCNDLFA